MTEYANDDAHPFTTVAFILARFGDEWASGSGVLVGRNDVLTASHLIYEPGYGVADEIEVYFSYDPSEDNPVYTVGRYRYYDDFDPDGDGSLFAGDGLASSLGDTEIDIALLSLTQAAGDQYGWMGMTFDFGSGYANITGHPGVYKDRMTNDNGFVSQDTTDNYIDITGLEVNPGNSGGPIWYDDGSGASVIGLVSSGIAAVSLAAHAEWILDAIAANDDLIGGTKGGIADDGDNVFTDVAGGGTFDGLAGIDTIVLPGSRTSYAVDLKKDGSVTMEDADDYVLIDIERAEFSDGVLIFDISGPNADAAYRLYGGAFDRRPDEDGLLFWTDFLDGGKGLHDAAARFLDSEEFRDLYGTGLSNAQFVDQVYFNILHRTGEASGVTFWTGFLARGDGDRGDILMRFTQEREYVEATVTDVDNGYWVT